LKSKGADLKEGDKTKTTPLMLACLTGRAHNVTYILSQVDVNNIKSKDRNSMMAIHYAALKGSIECMTILKEKGADLNATGKQSMTPIMIAAAHGHYDCVKFLLKNGGK